MCMEQLKKGGKEMLYRNNNEYKLFTFKATFIEDGVQKTEYGYDKELFNKRATAVIFEDIHYTEAQRDRLNEVKEYPESEFYSVQEYVLNNKILPGTQLAQFKNMEVIENSIMELTIIVLGGM